MGRLGAGVSVAMSKYMCGGPRCEMESISDFASRSEHSTRRSIMCEVFAQDLEHLLSVNGTPGQEFRYGPHEDRNN